jgi:hypothetical protein
MKRIILKLLITVLFIATPPTVLAQGPDKPEAGLSGNLQGGAYILQTDSRFYSDDTNRHVDDIDKPADTHEEIAGLASIYLHYQFEGGTAVYVGNPMEPGEDFVLSAGVSQPMGKSTLDVAAAWLPSNEVWKNPYQVVNARVKTDADVYGLHVQLQEVAGSPWEILYNIDRIDIEDDEIGDLENDLKRSGLTHELGAKYTLSLQKGLSFSPEISTTYGDIDGRSNAYREIKIGAQLKCIRPPWVFIGLVSGFHRQYQKTHPLFGKTLHESTIFTYAQAMRLNLFGMENLFASLGAGYAKSDANLDFFDSQTVLGLASVGINF